METTEWQPASVYNMVVWWDHYNGSPASTLAVQIAQKQLTISPRANWSYGCQLSTLQKRSVIQISAILWFTASAHYVCGVFSHFLSQLSAALSNRRRLYASCGRANPLMFDTFSTTALSRYWRHSFAVLRLSWIPSWKTHTIRWSYAGGWTRRGIAPCAPTRAQAQGWTMGPPISELHDAIHLPLGVGRRSLPCVSHRPFAPRLTRKAYFLKVIGESFKGNENGSSRFAIVQGSYHYRFAIQTYENILLIRDL
jgi:hypothetical protein